MVPLAPILHRSNHIQTTTATIQVGEVTAADMMVATGVEEMAVGVVVTSCDEKVRVASAASPNSRMQRSGSA